MSEPMTCPGCGAEECRRYHCYEDDIVEFQCRTEWYVDPEGGHLYPIDGDVSHGCLHRRLAQRDERNAALEARIKELESGLAALAPVVRAAARVVGAYGRGPLAGRLGLDLHHDTNGLIRAFCALPADLLERMGVDRG